MQLNAETFLQIVESLRSDKSPNNNEQRKMPRVGIRGRASIALLTRAGTKVYQVNIRDMSATGIGLLTSEPLLKVEQSFILLLPAAGEVTKRAMLCKVKRFSVLSATLYSVGASFEREIAADQLPQAVVPTAAHFAKGVDEAAVQDLEARLRSVTV